MICILGRKQSTDNTKWLEAVSRIEELVSLEELNAAVAQVSESIMNTTAGKKIAYAWSGGKDSLVIADICKNLGIENCVFGHNELEYPAFLNCMENKPDNCEVINSGQDLDWIAKRPAMLFPQNAVVVSRWYELVQKRAIRRYSNAHNLDMILVGHRKADGNYVGRGSNICSNNAGVTRFSPLANWPHEMVLAYIHYYDIPLPPIYEWKDGYRCGTHCWPSRVGMESVEAGWRDVYGIDPSIVEQAATKIESAAIFLEGVGM